MNGAGRVFYVYAALVEEAGRRAWLRQGMLLYVRDVVHEVQAWARGLIWEHELPILGFERMVRTGSDFVLSGQRVVEVDALNAATWLCRAMVHALRSGPTLTPTLEVAQALKQCDRALVAVFDRTGLIGDVSVPGFVSWALGGDDAEAETDPSLY